MRLGCALWHSCVFICRNGEQILPHPIQPYPSSLPSFLKSLPPPAVVCFSLSTAETIRQLHGPSLEQHWYRLLAGLALWGSA